MEQTPAPIGSGELAQEPSVPEVSFYGVQAALGELQQDVVVAARGPVGRKVSLYGDLRRNGETVREHFHRPR
jgi:hypothetical protein